jgi:hypothetical protein
MSTDLTADAVPQTGTTGVDPPAVNPLDEPTFEEGLSEWALFYALPQERIAAGHAGEFVACLGGVVRGYGPDSTSLRIRVAGELGVHPERLVISYLG